MGKPGRIGRSGGGMLALYVLAVVLVLFAEGVGWQTLISLFGTLDRGLTEVFQLARILALTAGTAASVWIGTRGRGFLRTLLVVWTGVAVTWGVVGGVAAAGSFVIVGDSAGELLRPFAGGFVLGIPRGLLLGWVVALPAAYLCRAPEPPTVVEQEPSPVEEPHPVGEPAAVAEPSPSVERTWGPYLILTTLIWVPVVLIGVGAWLFASDVTPANCPSLCFSDRGGIFFVLLYMSLYGLMPMWIVQLAALGVLRLNGRFRGWPVAVQAILVLIGGMAVLIAVTARWTLPILAEWLPTAGKWLLG